MRSIRRSLTLYFLTLLGLGLGAVAVLTDPFVGRTLEERKASATKLIIAGSNEREREAREKLDADLLNEAQTVYSRVLLARTDHERRFRTWFAVHEALFESAPFGRQAWIYGPYRPTAGKWYFDHVSPYDGILSAADPDGVPGPSSDFRQINITGRSGSGGEWRSKNMGAASFPIEDSPLDSDKASDIGYDTQVVNGVVVHRIVFKNIWGNRFPGPRPQQPSRGPREPGGGGRSQDRPPAAADSYARIYIHCARPVAVLEAEYAREAAKRDQDLRDLDAAVRRDHNRLRLSLAGVGLATFLGIVIGGPLLIRRGLAPVRNLSDAVSRVSEKDFHLPIKQDAMSHELLPIHARLTDTLDELRRAFEREKQAVADISHELRTPVAGMLATLDVVLRRPRTAEQYKTALEETRAIGRQLATLVERVMTLATLDAGADRTAVVEADITEMAAGCATVIRPLAVANGLTFETDWTGPVWATTDPNKLREVVTNLLHNAVEYNRPGGSIRLAVRAADNGAAVVEVTDTGIGMTPDVRDRIFERFFRADASRHAAGAHAGLGLSIVKEYVTRLGGTIAVESTPGVGSTFRVTLPASVRNPEGVTEGSQGWSAAEPLVR